MRLGAFGTVVTVVTLVSSVVLAQGTTSRATGLVSDSSGATVAGATVRLTNDATGVAFTTTTTDAGVYTFENVQVGDYTVAVEAAGFKKFASKGNRVSIGQPLTVNVSLEVGTVAESIEVSGSAETVQTSTSGNIGNVFSDKVIRDLPIVGARGRNPLDLVTRQPGVVSGANTGGGVHVNGARDRAWNYTLDGIDTNETSAGGSSFSPLRANPDSLAEFKVLTSNSTAEYGRNSGGQVAMVSRSGGNEFHGTGFWFYRTPSLNANEWENNVNNLGKRQFQQQIYGGSIGGPIKRNKTFFFYNTQRLTARNSNTVNSTVYTATARQGLWRYVQGGRNLPAGVAGASVDGAGNVMPGVSVGTYNVVARDPQGLGLDGRIKGLIDGTPLPNNFTGGDGLNTAFYTFSGIQNESQLDQTVKIDHVINDKNTIFGRYSWGFQNTICDSANSGLQRFPGGPCIVNTERDPKNLALNWRTNPTPRTTNELVFGLNRFAFDFVTPTTNLNGIQLENSSTPGSGNFIPITSPEELLAGNLRRLTTWQIVDNFAYFTGAHSIKFGFNVRLQRHQDQRGSIGGENSVQQVNFARLINPVDGTAFGIPSDINANFDRAPLESSINFLLGRVGSTGRGFPSEGDQFVAGLYDFTAKFNEYDFYVQDTWQVRRNFVLDLGLRWEIKGDPLSDPSGRVRAPNAVMTAGSAPSNTLKWQTGSLYNTDWNNWGPSVGFAWDPFSKGKTSIRSNYRIAFDRINTFLASSSVFQNLPGQVQGIRTQDYGQAGGRLSGLPALNPPGVSPSALAQPAAFGLSNITVFDPGFRSPTTHMWSFSIQQELARNFILEANYIGRRAYNLYGGYNVNQTEIFRNGFLDGFKTVQGGGQSPLINQLVRPLATGSETGSDAMRRLYPTELRNNAVSSVANDLTRRTVGGRTVPDAAGFGPYFFIPYPQFTNGANVVDSNDFSTYHALQTQVTKRMAQGLEAQFAYTWSKSLDTRSFDPAFSVVSTGNVQSASSTPFDIYNRKLNYALSDFDRTHVIQSYWVWELPFGRGKKFGSGMGGFANRIIGGWQVSGLLTWQSGRPFTVFSGFNTFGNVNNSTVNCNGCSRDMGEVQLRPDGVLWYFSQDDVAKMSIPGSGEMGNTGRNFFRGPDSFNMDASFMKRTTISERVNLEIRADATNLTNTPTFTIVNLSAQTNFSSTTFGRIRDQLQTTPGARKIQLGVKINF